jgi:hypothetical protein
LESPMVLLSASVSNSAKLAIRNLFT